MENLDTFVSEVFDDLNLAFSLRDNDLILLRIEELQHHIYYLNKFQEEELQLAIYRAKRLIGNPA